MKVKGISGASKKFIAGAAAVSLVLVFLLLLGVTIGRQGRTVNRDVNNGSTGVSSYKQAAETESTDATDKASTGQNAMPGDDTSQTGSTNTADSGKLIAELSKNIKTATLSVEVKKNSFDEKYGKLLILAEKYGGFVSDSRTSSSDGRITGGTVTMRIPSESFADAIGDCRGLGEVTSLEEQTEDVTDQYVDIDSRIRNLRAQEAIYLNLMARAQTIEESITVQRELSTLQGQIELLAGQKNYLDNRIQLSTISVYMNEAGAAAVGTGGGWGFVSALSEAVHGIVDGLNVVIRFLGNALIYILLAALAGLGVRFYIKRRNRSKPEPSGSPA